MTTNKQSEHARAVYDQLDAFYKAESAARRREQGKSEVNTDDEVREGVSYVDGAGNATATPVSAMTARQKLDHANRGTTRRRSSRDVAASEIGLSADQLSKLSSERKLALANAAIAKARA